MRHLDEGTIHAWLDGALSSEEVARVEAHVASCTDCAEAVAEARGLIAASSRILTALDNVPNVRGAKGAALPRRSLSTWLVRERIAAVVAVIVAGGALAVALSRGGSESSMIRVASEQARPVEVNMADSSPTPPPAALADARQETQKVGDVGGRGGSASNASRARDVASAVAATPTRRFHVDTTMPIVTTGVAAASRTDDTLRPAVVAQAQRAEPSEGKEEAKSSMADRLSRLERRRALAERPARYAEQTGVAAGSGRVAGEGVARLVHEETMTESGREVRRRIYQVEDILVTLDERQPNALEMREAAPPAAPVAAVSPVDSARDSTNVVRWTDARGAEFTLRGPVSPERLERIRKVLGY